MDSLININYSAKGKLTVSARELHKFLEVKTELSKWCSRMFEYGFTENEDYTQVIVKNDDNLRGGKSTLIDYALTINTAKEIAMIQRTEKGKQARQYFLECEQNLHNQSGQIEKIMQAVESINERLARVEQRGASEAQLQPSTDTTGASTSLSLLKQAVQVYKNERNPIKSASVYLPHEIAKAFPSGVTLSALSFVSEIFRECRTYKGKYTKCNATIKEEFGSISIRYRVP